LRLCCACVAPALRLRCACPSLGVSFRPRQNWPSACEGHWSVCVTQLLILSEFPKQFIANFTIETIIFLWGRYALGQIANTKSTCCYRYHPNSNHILNFQKKIPSFPRAQFKFSCCFTQAYFSIFRPISQHGAACIRWSTPRFT